MAGQITESERQDWHYTLSRNPRFTFEDMDLAAVIFSTTPFSLAERKGVMRTGARFTIRSIPALITMIKLKSIRLGSGDSSRKLPPGSWHITRYYTRKTCKDVAEVCAFVESYKESDDGYGSFQLRVEYLDSSGLLRSAEETFTLDTTWKGLYHVALSGPARQVPNRRF